MAREETAAPKPIEPEDAKQAVETCEGGDQDVHGRWMPATKMEAVKMAIAAEKSPRMFQGWSGFISPEESA